MFIHPTVSIIVPIYNVEEYLLETFESIYASLDNISSEIILVDDESTDHSAEIAQSFLLRNTHEKKIKFYTIPHSGVSAARNYGFNKATGKYLSFVDSDDLVPNDYYRVLIDLAEANNADLITCNVARLQNNTTKDSILHKLAFEGISTGMSHISVHASFIYDTLVTNKLIKRSFYKRRGIRFPDGYVYEDIFVSFLLHTKSRRTVFVDNVSYNWRIRTGNNKSITQRYDDFSNLKDRLYILSLVFKEASKYGDNMVMDELKRKVLNIDLKMYINKCKPGIMEDSVILEYKRNIHEFLIDHYESIDIYCNDNSLRSTYNELLVNSYDNS